MSKQNESQPSSEPTVEKIEAQSEASPEPSSVTSPTQTDKLSIKTSDSLLILSIVIIASCGLAYELIAGALASYVLGDSVLQFSVIIGTYLFAMGIGSHFSKYVPEDKLMQRFVEIEILVGLIGGLSAIVLFLAFAWLPKFQALLYALVFVIGMLVGMEIPLVMRILNQRKQEFNALVSKVLTFDYLGALVVSILFPLILAPKLGLARSAVLFGLFNVLIAGITTWSFFDNFSTDDTNTNNEPNDKKSTEKTTKLKVINKVRRSLLNKVVSVFCILLLAMVFADNLVKIAEQKRFSANIVFATSSPYQRLVVTERHGRYQLFLNGNLQFSTRDEYRYHEALVHPIMQSLQDNLTPMHSQSRVLILGGGDGMAAREVLKYANVAEVTLVDLDKKMTDTFATQPRFTELNNNSLTHKKMTVVNADAYKWLESYEGNPYDVIIIDLPDPSQYSLAKLYSVSMYTLIPKTLTSDGYMVVQATSPYYAPKSFWSINKTLQTANLQTTPYHAYVPSFGEWGFIIAQKPDRKVYAPPQKYDLPMKFLTPIISQAMFEFSPDMQEVRDIEANTIDRQSLVRYYQQDWGDE